MSGPSVPAARRRGSSRLEALAAPLSAPVRTCPWTRRTIQLLDEPPVHYRVVRKPAESWSAAGKSTTRGRLAGEASVSHSLSGTTDTRPSFSSLPLVPARLVYPPAPIARLFFGSRAFIATHAAPCWA
eukprot:2223289-Prymnesium_polylepis.1